MDRFNQVLDKAFPNVKTRENYKSRLRGLTKSLNEGDPIVILKAPDTYYPKLQQLYPSFSTRKNMLTLILVLFREDPTLKSENAEAAAKWKQFHDDLVRIQEAKVRRSEPEDKQVKQYTSYEEITEKYRELKTKTPHNTLKSSQQFLLLSILVHLRPKRADLGAVKVYKEDDPRKTDENYIVLRTEGTSYLVMNLYKTSKYYQTVEEDLPEELVKDLRTSLGRHPRDYVFTKENGEPMSNNTYSVFVKHIFEDLFGRSTGVSLLRHIYITEKLDFDDMTIQEQEDEAKLMLHTSGLQRRYKWPKKVICPKLCAPYMKIDTSPKTRKFKRKRTPKRSTKKTAKSRRDRQSLEY
jgi:hypothetical protein